MTAIIVTVPRPRGGSANLSGSSVSNVALKAWDHGSDDRYGKIGSGQVDGDDPRDADRLEPFQFPTEVLSQIVGGEGRHLTKQDRLCLPA